MDTFCQPGNCQRTKSMLSIIVDDFDSKIEKENVEKEKPSDEQPSENLQNKGKDLKNRREGTPDYSIQKILDEVEHRKDEFRKLIDEHNEVIENLKKIEKHEDSNLKEDADRSNLVKSQTPIRT